MVVFCCENSAWLAADAIDEAALLDAVDLVPLPCTGMIEIDEVLKCFERDHPAVLIAGCPIDNCKYLTGNLRAQKRVDMMKQALRQAGYDDKLVRLELLSSLDVHKLSTTIRTMQAYLYETKSSL